MKRIFLFMVLAFFAFPLISVEQPVKSETEKKDTVKTPEDIAKTLESYSWDNKKVSMGIEALNGIGTYGGISLLQVNVRFWLMPNLHISLHDSFNYSIPPDYRLFIPLLLNVGYGKSIKNMYWFVEGGIGRDNPFLPYSNEHIILNTSTGIEWLVTKDYAIGLNVKFGFLFGKYENYAFLNLSITANLVL